MLLYQKERYADYINPVKPLMSMMRHWALLKQLSWRHVEMPHRGSFLGFAWSFFNPLLIFGVYSFVFIAVFRGRYGVVPSETNTQYALGLLLGLTVLQLFQEVLVLSPYAILQNQNYVKKVVFPLEILPAAVFGAALIRFLICLGIVVIAIVIFGPPLDWNAIWLIPIVLCLCILSLGVAWLMAAVGVFLRDLGPFTQALSLLLMFMSAVFYSLSQIPPAFKFLRYNPLLIAVESTRGVLLWHIPPTAGWIWYLAGISLGVWILGYAVFRSLRGAFSDVL